MDKYLLAFFAPIVAGLVVGLIDARFRGLEVDSTAAETKPYPKRILLRFSAFTVIGGWISIALVMTSLVLDGVGVMPLGALFVAAFGAFLVSALGYMCIAFQIRCASCDLHILVQRTTVPPYQETYFGMEGWTSIILRVLMRKPFRCMYCVQRYVP